MVFAIISRLLTCGAKILWLMLGLTLPPSGSPRVSTRTPQLVFFYYCLLARAAVCFQQVPRTEIYRAGPEIDRSVPAGCFPAECESGIQRVTLSARPGCSTLFLHDPIQIAEERYVKAWSPSVFDHRHGSGGSCSQPRGSPALVRGGNRQAVRFSTAQGFLPGRYAIPTAKRNATMLHLPSGARALSFR
jgi:hypothetical protein